MRRGFDLDPRCIWELLKNYMGRYSTEMYHINIALE